MPDRKKVITEIEDALSDNLAKVGHVYRMSLNELKDKALKDALVLLKEQEPMQPKNIWHTIDHTSNGDCPTCGYEVNEFDNSMLCGRCGQLLDWRNL